MAQIVLVGAGVASLGTALSLGRAGHEVSILERDATPLPGPDRADPMADVPSARTPATGPGRCCARLRRLSRGSGRDGSSEVHAQLHGDLFGVDRPDEVSDRAQAPTADDVPLVG